MSVPTAAVSVDEQGTTGLHANGIVKRFAGVPALRGVTVAVRPGEVLGLVGHNGAGKSTLLQVLAGAQRPDEGSLHIDGQAVSFQLPADALQRGIATVYQELSLHPNLSVVQNVFLGRERRRAGLLDRAAMRQDAGELLDRFQLSLDVDRPLGDYSVAQRQLLEIAIATHRNARFLLLDEPTTSLEGDQVEHLLGLVRRLSSEDGLGILLVDHKLEELFSIADRVIALVNGEVRIDAAVADVTRTAVVQAIAGAEAARRLRAVDLPDEAPAPRSDPLVVRHLATAGVMSVDLIAFPGRVLGLYGLVGSGRTESLRAIAGIDPIRSGTITLRGAPFAPRSSHDAQRHGVVYLTEERKRDGLIPQLDAATNVALPVLSRYSRWGWLNRRTLRNDAQQLLSRLDVKGNRQGAVTYLSGGNQQKVLLARALAQNPDVLLLDEPTKGVDISVKVEIHRMIRDLAHNRGLTIIVASSEEEELLEVADDVAIFVRATCDGTTTPAATLTPADLRRAAWTVDTG